MSTYKPKNRLEYYNELEEMSCELPDTFREIAIQNSNVWDDNGYDLKPFGAWSDEELEYQFKEMDKHYWHDDEEE
jgi:hypothetical protein